MTFRPAGVYTQGSFGLRSNEKCRNQGAPGEMTTHSLDDPQMLERFRAYLHFLARAQMGDAPQGLLDPSDIVQQTMLEAHEKRAQCRATGDAERAAWLRTILARNVVDAFRAQKRLKRGAGKTRAIESLLEQSSLRLASFLASDDPTPSSLAGRHEDAVLLAGALATLPELQRRAIMLKYWNKSSVAEIAESLGKTRVAVAGLLKRGLGTLRDQLRDED